jgi:hypothetical protein
MPESKNRRILDGENAGASGLTVLKVQILGLGAVVDAGI